MPAFDGLYFYAVYVVPVTVLALLKLPKGKGLAVSLALLSALSAYQLRAEAAAMPSNYYELLGTPRGASSSDLRKAFRQASLRVHPDKDPSESAAAQFKQLTDAHAVLSAAAPTVQAYELHGAEAALASLGTARERALSKAKASAAGNTELRAVIAIFAFHVVWAVAAFLLSASLRGAASCRDWLFSGHLLATVAEISLQYQGLRLLPEALVAQTPVFEQVALLRSLIPPFTVLCCLAGAGTFVDAVEAAAVLQRELLDSNKELLVALGELKSEIASSAGGGGGGGGKGASAAAAALAGLNDDSTAAAGLASLKAAGVSPRRGKMDRVKAADSGSGSAGAGAGAGASTSEAAAAQAAQAAQAQAQRGGGMSFFHVIMALYAVKYVYENFLS
jgi:hypothetical protein